MVFGNFSLVKLVHIPQPILHLRNNKPPPVSQQSLSRLDIERLLECFKQIQGYGQLLFIELGVEERKVFKHLGSFCNYIEGFDHFENVAIMYFSQIFIYILKPEFILFNQTEVLSPVDFKPVPYS